VTSVDVSSRTGFDAGGFEVSNSGTGEESAGASVGNGAVNDIDSGRGIILEAVTRCCGEKYGTESKKRDICRYKIFSD